MIAEIPNESERAASRRLVRAREHSGGARRLDAETSRDGAPPRLAGRDRRFRAPGKAQLTRVTFVLGEGGALLVREGLAPTDDVVAAPSSEVREGEELSPSGG